MDDESESTVFTVSVPFVGWLIGRDRLAAVKLEDCEALAIDPASRLANGPLEFPSIGFLLYVLWAFPHALVACVIKFGVMDRAKSDIEYSLGVVFLAATAISYFICPSLMMRRQFCLESRGFVIRSGRRSTMVPWSCLLPGREWEGSVFQIRIPVHSSFRDEITTTVGDVSRTITEGARPVGIRIQNDAEIVVTWSYLLDMDLFIKVARRLATEHVDDQDEGDRKNAGHALEELPGVKLLTNGDLQIPVTAVRFPFVCCSCGDETDSTHDIGVACRHAWLFPSLARSTIEIPLCSDCWRSSWSRYLLAIAFIEAAWIVSISLLVFGTLPVFGSLSATAIYYLLLFVLGIFPTNWIVSFLSPLWRVARVVKNLTTNEIRIRFADPGYRDLVLQEIADA